MLLPGCPHALTRYVHGGQEDKADEVLSSIAASESEVAWLVRQRAASRGLDELDASSYLKRGGGSAEERRADEPERGSLKSASLRSSTKSTPARTPRAVEETPRSELVAQLHQLVSRLPVGQDRPLTRQLQ